MEPLEELVDMDAQKSLRQELSESVRNYPSTWKEYAKQLGPAVIISSIGAALGQHYAAKHGLDSKAAATTAAYVCGYIPGYTSFFGMEYFRNKKKYPSILSKEFGKFAYTFLAADYVADLTTFTPAFIASNLWMMEHTHIEPAVRSVVAWNSAALLYITSMAALHPVAQRINNAINSGVRSAYRKVQSWRHGASADHE